MRIRSFINAIDIIFTDQGSWLCRQRIDSCNIITLFTEMMNAVNSITSEFGVHVIQPFLSKKFIEFAKKIPLDEKIHGPDDLIRKHIIRKLALSIGIPTYSALKRKKALQYGSLIHKNLMKIRKTWNKIS